MAKPLHAHSDITPEQVRLLMQAARVERAQALRSMVLRLFRRRRETEAWPARGEVLGGVRSGC
jgi:hypothetical protein